MTYNMFGGTVNPTQLTVTFDLDLCFDLSRQVHCRTNFTIHDAMTLSC